MVFLHKQKRPYPPEGPVVIYKMSDAVKAPLQLQVGGEKGHTPEVLPRDCIFAHLFTRFPWRAIPGCQGRYSAAGRERMTKLTPLELLAAVGVDTSTVEVQWISVSTCSDVVLIVTFKDLSTTGLITYAKADGVYVHTLNTPTGFHRKLATLGFTHDGVRAVGVN